MIYPIKIYKIYARYLISYKELQNAPHRDVSHKDMQDTQDVPHKDIQDITRKDIQDIKDVTRKDIQDVLCDGEQVVPYKDIDVPHKDIQDVPIKM